MLKQFDGYDLDLLEESNNTRVNGMFRAKNKTSLLKALLLDGENSIDEMAEINLSKEVKKREPQSILKKKKKRSSNLS